MKIERQRKTLPLYSSANVLSYDERMGRWMNAQIALMAIKARSRLS
ncbi:MAG: hypothetical protein ICV78_01105 [Tolypothrix sp. Co-bin9]|nr:hypothetical protein [Tolypothrix sp. Co-bin9]